MIKNEQVFKNYIDQIAQRIDWLITACGASVMARENAREHLNNTVREILTEMFDVGFLAGEKSAKSFYIQKNMIQKYKTKEKTVKETRSEILEMVLKEYGLVDEKYNKKLRKKVLSEDQLEEDN